MRQDPKYSMRDYMIVHRRDEDDETPARPLDWRLIRRLFAYASPVKGKVRLLLGLTLVRSIQIPALTWSCSRVISGPIANHESDLLAIGVLIYAVVALSTDGLFHFRQRYALEIGETVVNGLRSHIFSHIQRMPMAYFGRMKIGRIIGRMTSDVESLRTGIQDVLFVSSIQLGQMFFCALIMAWRDWPLFLVVLGMVPVLWMTNRRFHGRLSKHSRAAQASFSRITATLAESVNGIRVTQGFVRQETNAGLFRLLLADHSKFNVALARTSAILTPLLELNSQFFIAVLLAFGGWRVCNGWMSLQGLIEFFFLANMFFAPVNIIANQYNQALVAMAGAERVFKLLDTQPDWEDDPRAGPLPDPREGAAEGGAAPAGMSVEFQDLCFEYEAGRPVLRNVSFRAEAGTMIALVGHTGSGKSTIVNLATKFYLPTSGRVLLDGRDVMLLQSGPLHRQMGIVPQQNFLFSGTVRENIRMARPGASDEQVRECVERLGCIDLLDTLPGGLDAPVGERGAGLSSGQRQLVCFARAMLADPRLLILDEATSAVDALTEERLRVALEVLLRGRTSIVVAHRLSTIRSAGLLLVMDGGRVVEHGTHDTLVYRGGHYTRLHERFLGGA